MSSASSGVSQSADQEASYNLAGARSPAIVAMIAAMVAAKTHEEFDDAVKAYDRVLFVGFLYRSAVLCTRAMDRLFRQARTSEVHSIVRGDNRQLVAEAALGCVGLLGFLSRGANRIQGCFWEAVLGVMNRLVLSDAAWERMAPLIIGRPDQERVDRARQSDVRGRCAVDRSAHRLSLARSSAGVWRLEQRVPALRSRWSLKGIWWRMLRGGVG